MTPWWLAAFAAFVGLATVGTLALLAYGRHLIARLSDPAEAVEDE